MGRLVGVVILAVLLTACGATGPAPMRQLVEQAIALELGQTQQELGKQLRLGAPPKSVDIDRVSITEQTPLLIDELQAFRVRGTYDVTVQRQQRRVTQSQNPFEVYLQRQKENKTWRLARLQTDEAGKPVWITQRVPQPDG
ncbi:hypothetical protein H6F43_21455 [Leptolyngbya sp. FACHB-36]|nr:hypothetical protein [Leptolyngbya sp. FACHB-36]